MFEAPQCTASQYKMEISASEYSTAPRFTANLAAPRRWRGMVDQEKLRPRTARRFMRALARRRRAAEDADERQYGGAKPSSSLREKLAALVTEARGMLRRRGD